MPLATDDVDVVQGYKIGRGDSLLRKVIGRCYHHAVKLLFRLPARDTDCDFRLFRRKLVIDRPLTSTSGVICVEMMRSFDEQGARLVETPVHHYFRPSGRSQFFRVPAVARSARQLLVAVVADGRARREPRPCAALGAAVARHDARRSARSAPCSCSRPAGAVRSPGDGRGSSATTGRSCSRDR